MPQMDFFPQRPEVHPMIYAYRDLNPDYDGLLKVGYTEKDVDRRVAQQYPTKRPDGKLPYEILYRSSAMREDGSCFTDHDVHRMLRRRKITGVGGEWFRCTVDELEAAERPGGPVRPSGGSAAERKDRQVNLVYTLAI